MADNNLRCPKVSALREAIRTGDEPSLMRLVTQSEGAPEWLISGRMRGVRRGLQAPSRAHGGRALQSVRPGLIPYI